MAREELKALRNTLGTGPANLLMFLAMIADGDEYGFAGPLTFKEIRTHMGFTVGPSTFLKWRRKLEEAGLVRVGRSTDNRQGYLYQLRGIESLPFAQWVEEFLKEEPGFIRVRERLVQARTAETKALEAAV